MLQDNLKSTIAQFAASDADAKAYIPRLITSTTTHTERVEPREVNKLAPVAVPCIFSITNSGSKVQISINPKLPPKPIANESYWSTVVRNGFKKTKTATIPASQQKTSTQPRSSGHQLDHRPVNNKMPIPMQQATRPQDKRLIIRLTDGHEWRKLSPADICEIIINKLAISPSAIGTIKPVRSGFALSPCTNEAREALLNAAIRLSPFGAKLESATNWTSVLILTVPKSLHTLNGHIEVTKELLSQEIERVTKMCPSFLKLYGRNFSEAPHRTWMAFFAKAPRSGFRVFDESGAMRTFKKQQSPEFCKRCNGYHPSKNCSRALSCGNCGSTIHSEALCMTQTRCKNCGGPHRSDSKKCLARLTRFGLPSKEQLKTYREAGEREYQAILRANAAEKMATTAER
ncbi:putative eka-like protein [Erysiphe necator]|uniref:Putative eka-like protein n=1 Tax=Uncinula necator TaxID=52586 RepID=A0A0B1NXK1_UNCNE|nr:putative eka-like protein [Erysiphe necator]